MYESIFTSTQLKTNLREVKAAADKGIVYITENGVVEYLFMSLDIYNSEVERIQAEARWEVSAGNVIRWASDEFARGEFDEVANGVYRTRTFTESLARPDIPAPAPSEATAIEYFSKSAGIGLDVSDLLERARPFGGRVFKLYYDGADIIYERRDNTGEILLCGLVPSVDQFKALVREGR